MPLSSARDHTMTFISGLHRSGTTQLSATLGTNPDISAMSNTGAPHDEGQHLQDVFPAARQHGGPGRFAFDPEAHLTEASPLATPEAAERLFDQWSQYWDLQRKVLLEKSPPNLIRMRFLQSLYPEARFVVIVRHPIVTALATRKLATTRLMRRTFREAPLEKTILHWFAAHDLFLHDLPSIRRVHLLRWEDLVADPAARLDDITQFVGVGGQTVVPNLDAGVDDKYRREWAGLVAGPSRQTAGVAAVLRRFAGVTARLGYRSDDLAALDPLDR